VADNAHVADPISVVGFQVSPPEGRKWKSKNRKS
jgi:hypothetical protein